MTQVKNDILLVANAKILDEYIQADVKGKVINSTIDGRVKVALDAQIINSTVRGQCVIGKDVVVENSFIGPYTSIGNGSPLATQTLSTA